jgi:hypothetical protein
MSRWLFLGVIVIAIGLGLSDLVQFSREPQTQVSPTSEQNPQQIEVNPTVPVPVQELRNPAGQIRSTRPIEIARLYLEEHRKQWKLQDHHQFVPQESMSPLGSRVRFGIYQDGIQVLGMGIELMVKSTGEVREISNDYVPLHRWTGDVKDFVSEDSISAKLKDSYELDSSVPISRALVPVPVSHDVEAVLVVSAKKIGRSETQTLLVRASDGQILNKAVPRKEF